MKQATKAAAMRLEKLERSLVSEWLRNDPILGSELGKNDEFDTKLPQGGPEQIQAGVAILRRYDSLFERLNPARLGPSDRVRLEAARHWIRLRRFELDDLRRWERFPDTARVLGRAIFQILGRSYAPLRARMARIQDRLDLIPKYIRQSMGRLRRPLRTPTEHELETITRLPAFFHNLKEIARAHLPLTPLTRLLRQLDEAQRAIEEYTNWLILDVLSHCEEEAPVAPVDVAALLRHRGVARRPEEIERQARQEADRARQRLREVGRRIRRKIPVEEVRDHIRSQHPHDFDGVLKFVRGEIQKARAFVQQSGLATVPRGELLYAVETPTYLRHLVGHAGYWPPAPFAAKPEGYLFLTPGDCDSDRLREYSFPALVGLVGRFAYPGQHLYSACHVVHRSPLRRLMDGLEMREGWGEYAERRMAELGYDDSPQGQFAQTLAALRRAVLARLDLEVATGRLAGPHPVNALIDELGTDRVVAEAEARRIVQDPLRHVAGFVGLGEIERAKVAVRDRMKAAFTEKAFHDMVLASGPLPLNLLEKELDWRVAADLAKAKAAKKGPAQEAVPAGRSR